MAPVFIFAEQIRKVVKSGNKVIDLAQGTRISSAAADLIKEHQIQIRTVAADEKATVETPDAVDKALASSPAEEQPKPLEKQAQEDRPRLSAEDTQHVSEDELEEIVNRVIERFQQIKGRSEQKTAAEESVGTVQAKTDEYDSDDLVICRCEEITRGEIKAAITNGMQTLNGIKRVTRAGMGLCQGQTCQQLVARILAEELGFNMADLDPTTARGPVRPLRLEVFANS